MTPPLRAGICLATAALIVAAPALANAAGLRWLVPDRAPGAPFEVGLVRVVEDGTIASASEAAIEAEGGRLEELGPSGPVRRFRITPQATQVAIDAEVSGERAGATIEVGPPALRIAVTADPPAPIKGRTESVELQIEVTGPDGMPPSPTQPVLRANVGTLGELEPTGVGRWRARYLLPEARHPEVAIVVAFLPWPHPDAAEGAFGSALIPLASAVTLPGRTEPNASIAVEIAGRTFGPVRSDANGDFELPVVVPPGHRFGASIATDRVGNRRRKQLDLHLPATDQLACVVNPARLPADGRSRARVVCVATDPYGAPVNEAELRGSAELGRLRGPVASGGAWEWELIAPTSLEKPCVPLLFEFPAGGPQSRESLCLPLTPLAASSAEVNVEPSPVFLQSRGRITVNATDSFGRPATFEPSLSVVRGQLGAFDEMDGRSADYSPPAALGNWRDAIIGVVHPAPGSEITAFRAEIEEGHLVVQGIDLAGRPVPHAELSIDDVSREADRTGLARFPMPAQKGAVEPIDLSARNGLHARMFLLRTASGVQLWPERPLVLPIPVHREIALAPPAPIDVRVELTEEQLRYVVRAPDGEVIRDREIAFEVVAADGTPVATGTPHEEEDGSVTVPLRGPHGGALVATVTDVATGVSAARRLVLP